MGACSSKSAHPVEHDQASAAAAAAPHQKRMNMAASSSGTQQTFALASAHLSRADQFVERRGSDLVLAGNRFRFASLNAPELLDGDVNGPFEVWDTFASLAAENAFGTAVTRTYTLRIKSQNIGRGHINGWHSEWNDWMWDEDRMKEMDLVLDEARKAGVKLIIPIINQDTGDDSNWVGSTVDLIRYRYGLNSNAEARQIDWWTDHTMIESFKLILDFLLNRVNSINGCRYGDDPTILAWETGNEMNHRGMRPAPASWTLIVAKHLKSRAPRTLVMDGSFARNDDIEACYPREVLESEDVDIISYHYYGSGDIRRVEKDCRIAKKHGKVFIAGEFGFFDRAEDYSAFLHAADKAGGAGSLVWSLRPHSSQGGFKTHGEGNGIYSYHIPGWKDSPHPEFDAREAPIVAAIRDASFKINGVKAPTSCPVPARPGRPWIAAQRQNGPAISFAGSAWAHRYQVVIRGADGSLAQQLKEVKDHTKEGCFGVEVGREVHSCAGRAQISVRGVSVDGVSGEESEPLVL
ncbi:hypothetical protein JCM10908_004228 [Rhodotorula pacifica]|uniref:uncharacterized protein n=1 Tax=Rhodotorula pacifica TaxID=1495444 RepID=UPI00316B027C